MKVKIKEVKNRGVLNEGRNSGMGFAFLKKTKSLVTREVVYKTVQPVSPCKDYLAEVVFTELTGIGTQGCGLKYPKKLNIQDKDYFYMAIQIQKTKDGAYHGYSTFEKDLNNLNDNYKNIEVFINKIEEDLQLKNKTTILKANDDYYLINVPKEWCISSIMISMYTLLIRCAQVYDGKQDHNEFMEKLSGDMKNIDGGLLKSALPKIKEILKTKKFVPQYKNDLKQAEDKNNKWWSPHNNGICSWNLKYEEEEKLIAV